VVTDKAEPPDGQIYEILARFDQAQSLLSVCHRSLSLNDAPDGPADEADVLADAIKKFRSVRNAFDEFAISLSRAGKTP
jgi:hypothetical protein